MSETELRKQIEEVALLVHAAEDRKDDRDFLARVYQEVDALAARYRELEGTLSELDKAKLDRTHGRRVRDIKRLAGLLPRIGQVSATPDRVDQRSGPGERMITGVSWRSETPSAATGGNKLRVGADIDAWCGVCKESVTHSIVALVGDEPKQVTCQVCNARHSYRTGPARRAATAPAAPVDSHERAQERRAEEQGREQRVRQANLVTEMFNAEEVLPFSPSQRYRVGQIIEHPQHGRGKVENVLRSSMIVRFASGGLKSVMLQ
jgi:hypothetical protein